LIAEHILRRIGLGIQIDQKGLPPGGGTECCQIAGDGRFADTAFLVENYSAHKSFPSGLVEIGVRRIEIINWENVIIANLAKKQGFRMGIGRSGQNT
jgi:hypothetical protein